MHPEYGRINSSIVDNKINVEVDLLREIHKTDKPCYTIEVREYLEKKINTIFNHTVKTVDLCRSIGSSLIVTVILDWIKNYSNMPISDHYLPGHYWLRNFTHSPKFWPLGFAYRHKSKYRVTNILFLEKRKYIQLNVRYWMVVTKVWHFFRDTYCTTYVRINGTSTLVAMTIWIYRFGHL